MKGLLFLFLSIFFAATVVAADPFVLPKEATVINRDESGKTWRMNGSLKMPFDTAKKLLMAQVGKTKFKLKHEIPLDENNKNHVLIVWTREKEILMMMIWSDQQKTYFSWGIAAQ